MPLFAVGGLGLNLTSADTLVFMEHDWNPMRDHQVVNVYIAVFMLFLFYSAISCLSGAEIYLKFQNLLSPHRIDD